MSSQNRSSSSPGGSSQAVDAAIYVKSQAERQLEGTDNAVEGGPDDSVHVPIGRSQHIEQPEQDSYEGKDAATVQSSGGAYPASKGHDRSQDGIEDVELEQKTTDLKIAPDTLSPTSKPVAADVIEQQRPSNPPPAPPKDSTYLDPTPQTPLASKSPSRTPSVKAFSNSGDETTKNHPNQQLTASSQLPMDDEDGDHDDGKFTHHEEGSGADSRSEIQSIMDQFDDEGGGPGEDEVMSPRLELTGSSLGGSIQHPPRTSSLEPINTPVLNPSTNSSSFHASLPPTTDAPSQLDQQFNPPAPPKTPSTHSFSLSSQADRGLSDPETPISPILHSSLHKLPPPEPDPDSDLPFDFHRFLEQLRHRTADPVAKFLRSFLTEFGKKQWMVHEQVKIISDFLAFITNKMALCEVWRGVSDAEFDNAREGMEKLVMNRLYSQTFSPAIPASQVAPGAKGKRKAPEKLLGVGRRGQHQEDVERDEVLAQKVRIYGWVREKHLDIEPVGDSGRKFLVLAQQGQCHPATSWIRKLKLFRALENQNVSCP